MIYVRRLDLHYFIGPEAVFAGGPLHPRVFALQMHRISRCCFAFQTAPRTKCEMRFHVKTAAHLLLTHGVL